MRRADLHEAPRGASRDHALHPLQRRSGADRAGVRLRCIRLPSVAPPSIVRLIDRPTVSEPCAADATPAEVLSQASPANIAGGGVCHDRSTPRRGFLKTATVPSVASSARSWPSRRTYVLFPVRRQDRRWRRRAGAGRRRRARSKRARRPCASQISAARAARRLVQGRPTCRSAPRGCRAARTASVTRAVGDLPAPRLRGRLRSGRRARSAARATPARSRSTASASHGPAKRGLDPLEATRRGRQVRRCSSARFKLDVAEREKA